MRLGRDLLRDAWLASDPTARWRLHLPVSRATGATAAAVISFELDAGCRLPRHVDSAEEVLLVVEGRGRSCVGRRLRDLEAEDLVVIPAGVPHELHNTGDGVLRAVGFFATPAPVSTFEEPVLPEGRTVRGLER